MKILTISFLVLACQYMSDSGLIINSNAQIQKKYNIDCDDCNIQLINRIIFNIDSVNTEEILFYLKCFNKTCFNNVEFSESANHLLFLLLQRNPSLIMNVIVSHEEEVDSDYILFNIENPVSDDIDLIKTKGEIENTIFEDEIKIRILHSISTSIEKYNTPKLSVECQSDSTK